MKLFQQRKARIRAEEGLREALRLWEEAGEALVVARKHFDFAENHYETEAAIYEMGAAEAKQSRALEEVRALALEEGFSGEFPCKYTISRR